LTVGRLGRERAAGDGSVKMFDGKTFQLPQTIEYSADSDNLRHERQEQASQPD